MLMKTYHVYILTNRHRTVLGTGVTGDLQRRVRAHANGEGSTFTARYRVTDPIYVEAYGQVGDAIRREKEIEGCRRGKKMVLVRSENLTLQALAVGVRAHAGLRRGEKAMLSLLGGLKALGYGRRLPA